MITDDRIKKALEGLRSGLMLSQIDIDLRSVPEIAAEAIKQYGDSAITFLTGTESLPHTQEVFWAICNTFEREPSEKLNEDEKNKLDLLKSIRKDLFEKLHDDGEFTLKEIKNADYSSTKETDIIGALMTKYFDLKETVEKMDLAIGDLTKYIEQNIPEKGGQGHKYANDKI